MLSLFPRNLNGTFKALFPFCFHDQINLDIKIYSAKKDIDSQSRTKAELDAYIWHTYFFTVIGGIS